MGGQEGLSTCRLLSRCSQGLDLPIHWPLLLYLYWVQLDDSLFCGASSSTETAFSTSVSQSMLVAHHLFQLLLYLKAVPLFSQLAKLLVIQWHLNILDLVCG
jgi:hypothetical protein